jgi:CheY-like chemotaxis protein
MPVPELRSVLCADDDPDIVAVLRATLTLIAGLEVRIARTGEQLLKLALERQPDLVLIDVMMPAPDGPTTLKRMRSIPLLAHIPVIFLTAKVLSSDIKQVLPLGALGLIAKPFEPLKLGEQIQALWEQRRDAPRTGEAGSAALVCAEVDELAGKFLARAKGDIARLRAIMGASGQADEAALREVERIAHKIRGSGAMLGFGRLSALAEAIEHMAAGILSNLLAHGPIAESALVRELSDCIEGLSSALEQSSSAPDAGASFQLAALGADPRAGAATSPRKAAS